MAAGPAIVVVMVADKLSGGTRCSSIAGWERRWTGGRHQQVSHSQEHQVTRQVPIHPHARWQRRHVVQIT